MTDFSNERLRFECLKLVTENGATSLATAEVFYLYCKGAFSDALAKPVRIETGRFFDKAQKHANDETVK